jgi:hypothetical protein
MNWEMVIAVLSGISMTAGAGVWVTHLIVARQLAGFENHLIEKLNSHYVLSAAYKERLEVWDVKHAEIERRLEKVEVRIE